MKDFEFAYDQNNGANDPRKALILALSSVGGHQMHNLAGKYVEQISLSNQDDVVERWIEGAAASGQYYVAYASIPDITSTAERLNYFNRILLRESVNTRWTKSGKLLWKAE